MFNFEIINSPFLLDEDIVKKIFTVIDQELAIKQKWILNIVFVSEDEINELNLKYRCKDYVTDVLSFHYYDNFDSLLVDQIAWELIFCWEKIIEQAREYNHWDEMEFYKLLIHSILHILWFDHENDNDYVIMNNLEENIWNKTFL